MKETFYYVDTDEIPGFIIQILMKYQDFSFSARSRDTIFFILVSPWLLT